MSRPDPRKLESWCREGATHDHGACGLLWNSADPRDAAAAARHADDLGAKERANDRDEQTRLATESVAGSLLALYGQVKVIGDWESAELDDGQTADERWRRATVIVDELVRAGLI